MKKKDEVSPREAAERERESTERELDRDAGRERDEKQETPQREVDYGEDVMQND